jgi:hypothetical protein
MGFTSDGNRMKGKVSSYTVSRRTYRSLNTHTHINGADDLVSHMLVDVYMPSYMYLYIDLERDRELSGIESYNKFL